MIEVTEVSQVEFEAAIRGMRNSWESHDKSDSGYKFDTTSYELDKFGMFKRTKNCNDFGYVIGENDLKLMKKLIKAGADHAKFMRQITLSFDLNAPLYWWKEFDTYKVGTTANSESTMHTIQRESFYNDGYFNNSLFSFDYDFLETLPYELFEQYAESCRLLEELRLKFNETKDKRYWRLLIQLLPSGWNQKRTITLNYAVLAGMYHSRKNHRLSEWTEFCKWIETLPYSELIAGE